MGAVVSKLMGKDKNPTMQQPPRLKRDIPAEIQFEILSWLPPTSVLRLRRVSKLWHGITDDKGFRDLHSRRSSSSSDHSTPLFFSLELPQGWQWSDPQLVFHMSWLGSNTRRDIRFDLGDASRLHDSLLHAHGRPPRKEDLESYLSNNTPICCNGLLCVAPKLYVDKISGPAVVCNPLMQEYVTLPPVRTNVFWQSMALGFSPSLGVYKAVHLVSMVENPVGKITVEVCTLGVDNVWRAKDANNLKRFEELSKGGGRALYVDGKIYWLIQLLEGNGGSGMLTFDVDNEDAYVTCNRLHELSWPWTDYYTEYYQLFRLRSSEVSLVVSRSTTYRVSAIQVWVLKEHGKEECVWDFRYNIELPTHNPSHVNTTLLAAWELSDGGFRFLAIPRIQSGFRWTSCTLYHKEP